MNVIQLFQKTFSNHSVFSDAKLVLFLLIQAYFKLPLTINNVRISLAKQIDIRHRRKEHFIENCLTQILVLHTAQDYYTILHL